MTGHPGILSPHRCVTIPIIIKGLGPTLIGSFYGLVDGPDIAKELLIRDVQRALYQDGRPYLIGGDWNVSTDTLLRWRQDGMHTLHIACPAHPTCVTHNASSIIDYFCSDTRVSMLLAEVTADLSHTAKPHRPVSAIIHRGPPTTRWSTSPSNRRAAPLMWLAPL